MNLLELMVVGSIAFTIFTCAAGGPEEAELIKNNTLMVLKSSANEVREELTKEAPCDEWCQQEKAFE